MKNYYDILGLSHQASADTIKKTYRKLALAYHPDRRRGFEEKFKELTEAYNVLKDPRKRALYDSRLKAYLDQSVEYQRDDTQRESSQRPTNTSGKSYSSRDYVFYENIIRSQLTVRVRLSPVIFAGVLSLHLMMNMVSMQSLLGLSTAGNYADGCMQDVHWPSGGIGYFPTYTLGAIAAAQFKAAMVADLPDVEAHIARGDFGPVRDWLDRKVWSQGSRFEMQELMIHATGKPLDAADFKTHLQARYLAQ